MNTTRENYQEHLARVAADKDAPWKCATCNKTVWRRLDGTFTDCKCTKDVKGGDV